MLSLPAQRHFIALQSQTKIELICLEAAVTCVHILAYSIGHVWFQHHLLLAKRRKSISLARTPSLCACEVQELFWGHETSHFGAGMMFLSLGFTASEETTLKTHLLGEQRGWFHAKSMYGRRRLCAWGLAGLANLLSIKTFEPRLFHDW